MKNDKNGATLSGLVSSEVTDIKNDNVLFTVSTFDQKSNNTRDFKVVAFTEAAKTLKAKIKTGQRVVFQGRLSSEELEADSKIYHGVFQVSRILAIDPVDGTDYSNGEIEGLATCDAIRKTKTGTSVATLNVKVSRSFLGKNKEEVTYPFYANVTLWGERADAIASKLPMKDVRISASGGLMPSEYPSTKHDNVMISKIEIWADTVSFLTDDGVSDAPPTRAPAPQRAAAPRQKVSDSNLPF